MIHQRCQHCGHRLEKSRVLVAAVHKETEEQVTSLLSNGGLEIHRADEGREIFSTLELLRPEMVVLEKGLPKIFGFEIFELIKKSSRLKNVHVILIEPDHYSDETEQTTSLPGVDAILQEDSIQEVLLLKVAELLPERFWMDDAVLNEYHPPALEISSPAAEYGVEESPITEMSEEEARLREDTRRLARTIVSDIVLYNPEKVAEGIRNGNFWELLREDLEEGRRLFQERVPSNLPPDDDYYQAAIMDFLHRQGYEAADGFPLR